jgi:hypothetical protein
MPADAAAYGVCRAIRRDDERVASFAALRLPAATAIRHTANMSAQPPPSRCARFTPLIISAATRWQTDCWRASCGDSTMPPKRHAMHPASGHASCRHRHVHLLTIAAAATSHAVCLRLLPAPIVCLRRLSFEAEEEPPMLRSPAAGDAVSFAVADAELFHNQYTPRRHCYADAAFRRYRIFAAASHMHVLRRYFASRRRRHAFSAPSICYSRATLRQPAAIEDNILFTMTFIICRLRLYSVASATRRRHAVIAFSRRFSRRAMSRHAAATRCFAAAATCPPLFEYHIDATFATPHLSPETLI